MRTQLLGLSLAGVLAATGTAYAVSVAEAHDAAQPSAQKAPVVGTSAVLLALIGARADSASANEPGAGAAALCGAPGAAAS